jgi:hypothetical protein
MNIFILLSFSHLILPYNGKVFTSGTAFSTNKEEPENLFWNPAGMGKNAYIVSAFNYSDLMGSFGKILKLNSFNLGVGVQLISSESMIKRTTTGDSIGVFTYREAVPVIAGNMEINKFIIGAKAFLSYTTVDEYTSYGAGIDLGGIYSPSELLSFSFYLRNFGKQVTSFVSEKEYFPVDFRFGALLNLNKKKFSLEYSSLLGICSSISYDFDKKFGFTAGYNTKIGNFQGIDSSFLSGFSFAIDIEYHKIEISIGGIVSGPLGISKSLSISFLP